MTNTLGSPGVNLRGYLDERGTLDAALACRVGAQIASELAQAHANGVLHGGVQPETIRLDQPGYPPSARLTGRGATLAPQYLAPELMMGVAPDFRADNYALGIVLYEMLCGTTPFAGLPPDAAMQARASMNPGRPNGIDDRLWNLIAALLSRDPAQRPADAGAVARQLDMLANSLAGTPQLPRLVTPPQPVPAGPVAPPPGYPSPAAPTAPPYGYPGPPAPAPSQYGVGAPQPNASMRSPDFPPTQPSGNKNRTMLLALLGVLAIVAVALVATFGFGLRAWSPGSTSSTGNVKAPSSQRSTANTPVRSATTGPAAPSTTVPEPTPTTEPTEQPASAAAWPPEGTSLCDPWLAVNDVTSCSFAGNVASAYFTYGEGQLSVYSPVTGQWYDMSCYAVAGSIVKCMGGSNAVVYVRQ